MGAGGAHSHLNGQQEMPHASLPPAYRPCVGLMVINRGGLVWVGRRVVGKGVAEGSASWWQMPQGGIDHGEAPRDAALRELREETAMVSVRIVGEISEWLHYDLPPHLVPKSWGGRYRGQKQKWFALRFEGHDTEIDIAPSPGQPAEFDAWQWREPSELVESIVGFKRDIYRRVITEFAPLMQL